MSIWNSVKSTVGRLTGTSAKVYVEGQVGTVSPGATVPVTVIVENGDLELEIRQVLLEVKAMEHVNVPKSASPLNMVGDALTLSLDALASPSRVGSDTARSSRLLQDQHEMSYQSHHCTYKTSIRVGQSKTMKPNEKVRYEGKITFPSGVQPTYQGKYCNHTWQLRSRVDILGKDPNSGWYSFRVCVPE